MWKWFIIPAAALIGAGGGLPGIIGMGLIGATIALVIESNDRRRRAGAVAAKQQSSERQRKQPASVQSSKAAPFESQDSGDRIALLFEFEDLLADAVAGTLIDEETKAALQREINARRRRLFGGYAEVPVNSRLASKHVPLAAPPESPATAPASAPTPEPQVEPEVAKPEPVAPEAPTPRSAPPAPKPQVEREATESEPATATPKASPTSRPAPTTRPTPSRKAPTPRPDRAPAAPRRTASQARPAASSARPKPAPRVAPKPKPAEPGKFAVGFRKLRAATVKGWKSFASDVAINTFTYLGVLLLVVVTFSFFSFGFFGDVFSEPNMRPFVEAGIPLTLFGIAWLLRRHTGIPFTANAIGLIGALVLPIMLSASFQDGSMIPPDVNGPERWMAYAGVGLLLGLIYIVAAFRSRMYAYLVGPGLWAGVGALGLYLEDGLSVFTEAGPVAFTSDGISGAQMVLVAFAIGLTVPLAGAIRRTRIGQRISVPLVRTATVALLPVAAVATAFAYSDAELAGIARPGIRDLAPELPLAMLAIAGGALAARRAGFAWAALGPRLRKAVETSLGAAGYVALAASVPVLTDLGVTVAWLGVAYVVLAFVVAGFGLRTGLRGMEAWFVRLVGIVGLALSLGAPGATIAGWAMLLAVAVAFWRVPAATRIGEQILWIDGERRPPPAVLVAVPLLVIIGPGAARMAWELGTPWVLAAAALCLAASRFGAGSMRELRPLAVIPAGLTAAAAVVTASLLTADGVMAAPGLAGVLALVAVAAFLMPVHPGFRTAVVSGLVIAAADIELRHLLTPGVSAAQVDAIVFAGAAVLLVAAGSLVARLPRAAGITADSLGLAASIAALGLGWTDDVGVVVGLGSLVAAFGAVALGGGLDRSPLVGAGARALDVPTSTIAAAPGAVAAVALPFLTVLGGELMPLVAAEPARSGLVLVATSWIYTAIAAIPRRRSARLLVGAAGVVVGAVGIAVTAPSLTGSVIAVGSLAAMFGMHAALMRNPGIAALGWVAALPFVLLLTHRLGVEVRDLHFVVFGVAVALIVPLAGVIGVQRVKPGSHWIWPPLGLGLILLPVAVAFGIADSRLLGVIAFGAAAMYLLVGFAIRNGAVALVVSSLVSIGYAHQVEAWHSPFVEPMVWMPLVALFALVAVVVPGHRPIDPTRHARPGMLAATGGLNALALVTTATEGATDWVTLATAGVLGILAVGLRSRIASYAAMFAAVASGLLFGDGWAALALLGAALAVGIHATVAFPSPHARPLASGSAVLFGGAYAALAAWRDWSPEMVIVVTGAVAGVLVVPAMVLWLRGVGGRVGIWTWPVHGLAQAGAVTVIGVAVAEFVAPGMFGPVAAVLAAEAVLVGVAATVRIRVEWAGVSAVLFGGAYAALAAWRDWSPEMVIVVTGAVAGVLVVPAMVLWLRGVGGRVGIWTWPLHGLAQAGAITVASVAGEVAGYDAAGIVAAVLLAEAVLAAIAAIVRVHVGWATGAAALLAAAYAGLGIWQRWTPTTLIAITGAVAGGLAVVATVGLLSGRLRPRGVIWIWPMHGLAQLGVVTILIAGFDRLPQVEFLGVLAAVSVGEALLVGLAAGITGRSGLAAAATGLVGIAYTAFVGWMQWPDTVIAAVTAPTSVVVGAFAVTAWLFANRIRIRIWVAWLHLLAQIGILSSGLVLSPDAATSTQLWVWALICAGEAALAALAASRLPEWPLRPLSVLAALGAGALGLAAAGDGPLGLPLSALLLITAGAIAVGAAVRPEPATASALWTLAGGFAAESLLFTTATFGADSLQVATVLGIAGAALAMLGVGTGRWGFLQGGLLLWLGPIAIVGNRFGAGRPHPYVVGAAVVLLIVIEIERIRRRAADRPMPEQLHLAEWAFLVVPMGLAALDTIDRSMAYALLLGVEAAVVLLWSLATEVRRRLLVGTAGLTIAVLLPVAISVAQSAEGGFASGTWLSIGAVAAVCFILIGSLLEKNRVRLGRMVSRISHSLEGWE